MMPVVLKPRHRSASRAGSDWLDSTEARAQYAQMVASFLNLPLRLRHFHGPLKASSSDVETVVQGLSVNEVAFTVLGFALGPPLLALPYALAESGILGIAVLFLLNGLNCATSALMSRVLDRLAASADRRAVPLLQRDWSFLAAEVWGPAGKLAMRVFLSLGLGGYIVAYIVVASVHLQVLLHRAYPLSAPFCTMVASAVALLLCFVPPKAFVPVNALTSIFFSLGCVAFLATGLLLPEWPEVESLPLFDASGLKHGVGTMLYVGAIHCCCPTIKQTMQDPLHYEKANARGYAAIIVLLLVLAIPGYLMFGAAVQVTFVSNIGKGLDLQPLQSFSFGKALRSLSAAGIMLKNSCLVPLTAKPLAVILVGTLPTPWHDDARMTNFFQALVVILSMCMAIRFSDRMGTVVDVIGGVLGSTISLVVPTLSYWRLFREELSLWTRLGLLAPMVVGVGIMINTLLLQLER